MINIFYTIIGLFNQIFVQIQISAKNPIHRIAAQISIFLTGSFIFILLDNYFQGLTYIIVYVGSIAIQFQFVIMLIEQPSVGSNQEINNDIQNHSSVLTYYIQTKNIFKEGLKKEQSFSCINKNKKFKKEISYNLKDILTYYNNININDNNNKNKILILIKRRSNFNSEEKPPFNPNRMIPVFISSRFYEESCYPMITEPVTIPDITESCYLISELVTIPYITIPSPMSFSNSLEIFNYFYPTWAIEFKVITDIETQGIIIYVAYPFAQIQISIALWTVMIGIISICSPRRLLLFFR